MQLNESDLAFLRRILRRYDGDLQVVGSELQVSPRGDVRRGTVNLDLNSQLRRARATARSRTSGNRSDGNWLGHATGEPRQWNQHGRTGSRPVRAAQARACCAIACGQRSEHIGHVEVRNSGEAQASR